jgi:prepilin peptidase CpaA
MMVLSQESIYVSVSVICAGIASVYDFRYRRIPNLLTGPAILFGLLLHLVLGGPAQLGMAALAGLIAGGIFLVFYIAGGMGAGDVKLMTAVGCVVGMSEVKNVMVSTVLIGAAFAVVMAVRHGRLRQTITNIARLVRHHGSEGLTSHPELNVGNSNTLRLPYALPIAAGCLVTFYLVSVQGLSR